MSSDDFQFRQGSEVFHTSENLWVDFRDPTAASSVDQCRESPVVERPLPLLFFVSLLDLLLQINPSRFKGLYFESA